MKRVHEKGQAILEMTVAMVALSFLILGVIFMTGLCIGNVDLLLSARENADRGSLSSNYGSAGSEVVNWSFDSYKKLNGEEVQLRYMVKDRPVGTADLATREVPGKMALAQDSGSTRMDDAENYEKYRFVPFDDLPLDRASSTAAEIRNTWGQGYLAAALVRGTADPDCAEIATLDAGKSNGNFTADDVVKMESAFARLFGVDPRRFDLKSAESNKVYMPAAVLPGSEPDSVQ